jgi:two-component system, NtrC family, response regulator AtoC
VRELAHAIEAAVLACEGGRIRTAHLPLSVVSPPPPAAEESGGAGPPPSRRYTFFGSASEERRRIEAALRRYRGNRTRAAAALGMARNTLRGKIDALGVLEETGAPAAD